jgi:hypothetical protein
MAERACPLCGGVGCEECDHTGVRYRQTWDAPDGVTISVTGSGAFNPELAEAFEAIAKAAVEKLNESEPVTSPVSSLEHCPATQPFPKETN